MDNGIVSRFTRTVPPSDNYDTLFVQRGAEEVFRIAADDARKLRALVLSMKKVLCDAQAAIWDAHYGNGISAEYANKIDSAIRAALRVDK